MHRPDHRRAGMTLVELLVVVAIIGLLAVTVLPNLSNTAETRRTRETARAVSTWVSKAQSRAIGRTEWAGFWILPVNPAVPYAAAIDIQLADVPEVYRGESLQSQVTVAAPGNVTPNPPIPAWAYRELAWTPAGSFGTGRSITPGVHGTTTTPGSAGDLIRFDGSGPWFELLALTSSPLTFGMKFRGLGTTQGTSGQNPLNTPWPLETVPHAYEILRQPVRTGAPYSFADGRCIDLVWSGYTSTGNGTGYQAFGVDTDNDAFRDSAPLAILFDSTGRVRELFHRGTRVAVEGAIYLLVGRADRAGQGLATLNPNDDSVGANWQYGDSYWIAIDPNSGMAKVAEVTVTPSTTVGNALIDSQEYIRSQLVTGGR